MASPLLRILLAAVALVAACAAPAAAQAPVGAAPDPAAIADQMAARWVALQRPSGSFPDSIRQQRGWGRYGEAGLGYGLMLSGLRAGRPDWIQAGARAQRFAIAQALDRSSVFESMLIASGYNLLRLRAPQTPLFVTDRGAWEGYLRDIRPLFDASIKQPYLSSNKYLVEAVLGLELHNTGLASETRGATLNVPGEARRRALHIIDELVPERVGMLRGRADGHRTTALSDRYAQPPAYHALAAGFLARAIDLAGGAANRRARKALRIAVRTMWAYQSPDGDVAYMGRSQGQAWALAFALLASARAAGRGCDDQTQDFLAVGDRAVRRLGALHPVGPDGMAIVPSANGPATIPALDDYAGDVVYNGLTLTALEWAIKDTRRRPGCLPDAIMAERARADAVLRFETGTFAVLRRGRVWMAVKRASQGDDPRTGFGLRALKYLGDDGRWVDLMPAAPRLAGAPTTLGPALIPRSGRLAVPKGAHLKTTNGRITIDGGWVTPKGKWVRRGIFRWIPTRRGVRMVVPAKRRDTILTSSLFTGRPAAAGRIAATRRTTVRVGGTPTVGVQGPLASTTSLDAWRADFTIRPRGKKLTIRVEAPPPPA